VGGEGATLGEKNLKKREYLEDLGVDVRVTLKCIF
jgi:hypothetical protein